MVSLFESHRDIMLDSENQLTAILDDWDAIAADPDLLKAKLTAARNRIHDVAHSSVNYQEVVDNLDDNILIAGRDERVIYINPAYSQNIGVAPGEIIGRRVSDILAEGKYFTVATVPEVLQKKKKVMKLSSLHNRQNSLGFVVGVPVFDDAGEVAYVIATNRNVSTFSELRENFVGFINALNEVKAADTPVHIYNDSDSLSEKKMIGSSEAIARIYNFIDNVGKTDATVLITGESGVGKELIADAIYRASPRSGKPIIKINCASIPATLLESELFGYEKGAFSGANDKGKKGLFEAANKGTLLLDEIGDMPLELQSKLLRAIQSNEITRVGGVTPVKLDIRLIASTNSDLKQKIKDGTFRSDLYYRLHVIPINVPPLRERAGDIPELCQHFLQQFCQKYNKSVTLTPENIELLTHYSWPGNIRELRNAMEYIVVCTAEGEGVDNSLIYGTFDIGTENAYVDYNADMGLSQAVEAYEKEYIRNALKDVRNLKEAGEKLNIDASTVSRKLKQYGLTLK